MGLMRFEGRPRGDHRQGRSDRAAAWTRAASRVVLGKLTKEKSGKWAAVRDSQGRTGELPRRRDAIAYLVKRSG